MKRQNILSFIIFALLIIPFLFNIFNSGGEGYFMGLWDATTLIIVNVGAVLIYSSIFQNTKLCSKDFSVYKLIWLQELFIILGIFGSIMGVTTLIVNMEVPPPPGVDPLASLVSNMAVCSLALIYGFFGAIITYMVQKYNELQPIINDTANIEQPKEGFKLLSFIYFIIYILINVLVLALFSTNSEGVFVFPFESVYYIGIISIILILFYRGNSLFRLLKNIFWYVSDTKSNINYNLKFIRNIKKILAMIIFVSLLCAPIMMLTVLAMPPQESNILDFNFLTFSGLKHGGIQFYWILTTIILLTIIEGREVTKLYYLTGEISSGDRFFSIKYVLGPMFLMLFIFIIGIIQSLLF